MFCFLLAAIVLTAAQGQCENWKKYFEENNKKYFYNKDSIHYPKQKKSLFGLQVRNKEIVNVWIKRDDEGYRRLRQIYCAERSCKGCVFGIMWASDRVDPKVEQHEKVTIEPGSEAEILLKKVCP